MEHVERIVTVKAAIPNKILPDEVQDEIVRNIGSKLDRKKPGVPLMGLNEIEREIILPSILNITPSNEKWDQQVSLFYQNLTIHVPSSGKRLNITTSKQDRTVRGKTVQGFDYPVSPLDYVMYKQCLADKTVAKNFKESKQGVYRFYIDDEQAEKVRESVNFKSIQKLNAKFLQLVELDEKTDDYKNKNDIKYVARLIGRNPVAHTIEELVGFIDELYKRSVEEIKDGVLIENTQFVKVVDDPKRTQKAFVLSLLEYNLIIKSGNHYVDREDPNLVLGDGLDETLNFLNNQANHSKYLQYRRELEAILKPHSVKEQITEV